jgi:hypothetical protein
MLSGRPLRLLVTLLVWAALGTLGVLVATAISAPQASARNEDVNIATGKGTVPLPKSRIVQFNFVAKDRDGNPSTDRAEGHFSIKFADQFIKGKVKCLRVSSSSSAYFMGRVTDTNVPEVKHQWRTFSVFDSGQPEGAGDLLGLGATTNGPECVPPSGGGTPLTSGNITVKDVTEASSS